MIMTKLYKKEKELHYNNWMYLEINIPNIRLKHALILLDRVTYIKHRNIHIKQTR